MVPGPCSHSQLTVAGLSIVAQKQIICLAMQETWVQSLGWENLLQKEMATHSGILARIITWTEEPGGHDLATKSKK